MALEKVFQELRIRIQKLRQALEFLSTTVEEDKPRRGDVVVAATLADALLAVRGTLEESRAAADDALQAVGHPIYNDRARRALTTCQELFHRFANQFSADLVSYERIDDLTSIGRERGQHWLGWATVVKESLEQCRALAEEVREGLFLCWQELAERIGMTSISVQNTAIGQQISAPELAGRETVHDGIT